MIEGRIDKLKDTSVFDKKNNKQVYLTQNNYQPATQYEMGNSLPLSSPHLPNFEIFMLISKYQYGQN